MKLLQRLILCGVLVFGGQIAHAQSMAPIERVVDVLVSQGFEIDEIRRTWLGRIRIQAHSGKINREVVVNRITGEILRDYWREEEDDDDSDNYRRDGRKTVGDDDHDDDDRNSNSGSGSSNSGSGSSNSGKGSSNSGSGSSGSGKDNDDDDDDDDDD